MKSKNHFRLGRPIFRKGYLVFVINAWMVVVRSMNPVLCFFEWAGVGISKHRNKTAITLLRKRPLSSSDARPCNLT